MGARADMLASARSSYIGTMIGSSFVSGRGFSISYTSPVSASVGDSASLSVTASGGSAPITYAVLSGALPTGLSLDTGTGAITGTYTTEGSFAATIRATDNDANIADKAIVWTVTLPGDFFSPYGYGSEPPWGI